MKIINLPLILCILLVLNSCSSVDQADVSLNKDNQLCFSTNWQGKDDIYYLYEISVTDRSQSVGHEVWSAWYGELSKKPDISTRDLCLSYGETITGSKTNIPAKTLELNKPYEVVISMVTPRLSANGRDFRNQFCLTKENNVLVIKKADATNSGLSCTNEDFTIKERSWFERLFG